MKSKSNKVTTEENYLRIFIIVALSLIVCSIAYPIIVNSIFNDWSISGTFGDSFGALNSLFSGFALAGVIVTILIQRKELKNQQIELSLQRLEMKETRKEFLINRVTNLVYNQLDRFENSITDLIIYHVGNTYKGHDAISFLDNEKEIVLNPIHKPQEVYADEMKVATISALKRYNPNKSNIDKFAHTAYNSVEVLKRLIYKTNLNINELNDLKHLFFENIGFINMGIIEHIVDVVKNETKYLKSNDYKPNELEVCELVHANIFLEPIVDFYKLRLTPENFEEHKAQWIHDRGNAE